MKKRATLIVLDSVGIGYLPDAAQFGDEGAHTLGHIYDRTHMKIPNMLELGLGNIAGSMLPTVQSPKGCYGKSEEKTKAKDTTSGHWEMAGVIMDPPFRTYPNGFPKKVIYEFERRTGRGTLGNIVASGTEIIQVLGDEHVKTGKLIVYTSADSVFQIAAHEDVVPVKELYRYCEIARKILTGKYGVGRVIARPFVGTYPDFVRTENRHDFSLTPPGDTMLDLIKRKGLDTIGVGKIYDIFNGKGIKETYHIHDNADGMRVTKELQAKDFNGLCFVNLVDFDMKYGHRNDVDGYAKAVAEFDAWLPTFMRDMKADDVLMITSDHGCDPLTPSTDHSREYIFLLATGETLKENVNLGTLDGYSDISATILDMFGIENTLQGKSFLKQIEKQQ